MQGLVNVQGTITDLNVGTLATIRAAVLAGVASLADAQAEAVTLGGGTSLAKITHVVGSSASITSVGSGLTALGTIAVTGAVVGDVVVISPKTAPHTTINLGLAWVPSVNTVNFQVQQNASTEGSFVAVGWDVLLIKKT